MPRLPHRRPCNPERDGQHTTNEKRPDRHKHRSIMFHGHMTSRDTRRGQFPNMCLSVEDSVFTKNQRLSSFGSATGSDCHRKIPISSQWDIPRCLFHSKTEYGQMWPSGECRTICDMVQYLAFNESIGYFILFSTCSMPNIDWCTLSLICSKFISCICE